MSSSTFGTTVATAVQSAWDYIFAGLVSGNLWIYLIGVTILGGIVGMVVMGVKHIFHRR